MVMPTSNKRPVGFFPLGIFFFFGAVMATYAGFTLLWPGTFLDRAWALNQAAQVQLSSVGRIVAAPFAILATVLLLAGIGWFRRRYWGWVLGVTVIAINLTGDLIHMALGDFLKSAVGVVIAGLLLIYMTQPGVREYFRGPRFP